MKKEKEVEEKKVVEEAIKTEEDSEKRREVLIFHKDNKGNYVSRLPNNKIVLHHRKDSVQEIIEGLEYECILEEKTHWAFAWIAGIRYYPRVILKDDFTCISMENSKKRELFPDILSAIKALKKKTNSRYILVITPEGETTGKW
ncbi:MAG: hypothetical protein KAX49_03675 [Halanaerobiales bacterium]|nr:hypothetical protein [Halanaerobiales bacterium]